MPSTSTTKIYYVDPSATSLSTHLALISPLVDINGDNAYSPLLPDTQNYTVALNTSLTRPTTRWHLNIPLSYRVSKTNKSNHHESCSTKNKPYSKLQIKYFNCCVLLKQ